MRKGHIDIRISLPKDVEQSIHAEVVSGHFVSADEAIAAAWRVFQQQRRVRPRGPEAGEGQAARGHKPIWEVIEEENREIPPEVWDALPDDLSDQHDNYLYGTPRRPTE